MTTETKDIITLIISSATFITSLVFFWLAKKQTKKNNTIPALIDYLCEWRKEDGIKQSWYYIRDHLTQEDILNEKKFTLYTFPDTDKKNHATNVSHYFDQLGLLVYSGILEEDQLLSFVGSNAEAAWEKLKNIIIAQREINKKEKGDVHYQRHFEYFAALHKERKAAIKEELNQLAREKNLHMVDEEELVSSSYSSSIDGEEEL